MFEATIRAIAKTRIFFAWLAIRTKGAKIPSVAKRKQNAKSIEPNGIGNSSQQAFFHASNTLKYASPRSFPQISKLF
jgi:hypothetical protein